MRWIVGIAGAIALLVAAPSAHAGRIVVADTYAEADLADHAGAVTLLLRAALDRPGRAVVPPAELDAAALRLDRPEQLVPALAALGADGAIACDLVRAGTGLRASLLAIDAQGAVVAAGSVSAGAGDVSGLVRGLIRLAGPLGDTDATVPSVSVGQLRPFVAAAAAIRTGDLAAAARALASAEPLVPVKVTSIGVTLRPGWAGAAVDRPTALLIALAAGTPQDILDLAPGSSPRERAARALARLAGAALDAAAAELTGRAARDPWLEIATARLAHARGDHALVESTIRRLLAGPAPFPPALALVASLPAGAVPPAVEDEALAQARTDPSWSRLASLIGLHVASRNPDALAAIRVLDLDDSELSQLEPIVRRAAADGARDGLRLATEAATRGVDPAAIDAAVARWQASAADDPAVYLVRGRLALAAGRLDDARDAFAAAKADREQARVAIARGDWATAARLLETAPADSIEKDLVTTRVAIARDDTAAARVQIEHARARAPANADALRILAEVLERDGEPAPASTAVTLANRLAPPPIGTPVDLAPVGTHPLGPAGDAGVGVGPAPGPPADRLTDELAAMIPALQLPPRAAVALVGVHVPAAGWLSLRETDPRPLRPALAAALTDLGYFVAAGRSAWIDEPFDATRLEAALGGVDAPYVVVYRLRTEGDRASLRLVGIDRKSGNGHAVDRTLPGTRYGLVGWNRDRILVLGILALVLLGLAGLWFIRGRSRVVVDLTLDPDGSDEVLAIELSRVARRPTIPDPARFRRDQRRAGHEVTARSARLPTAQTLFKVAPGPWYIHVYGVYTRDHVDRLVPPLHSHKIDVARGATAVVQVDLGLPVAEIKVTIHDARRAGIAVWLDNALADKVYTDLDGQATVYATIGAHTLYVDATDVRIERPLSITAAQIEKVMINLPRERRLAEVSGGLSLGPATPGAASEPAGDARAEPGQDAAGRATPDPTAGRATPDPTGRATPDPTGRATPDPTRRGEPDSTRDADTRRGRLSGQYAVAGAEGRRARPSAPIPVPDGLPLDAPAPRPHRAPIVIAAARSPNAAAAAAAVTAPASSSLLAPEPAVATMILGRYRIDAELGRGAMGVVFKAWDCHLERDVAVKILARAVREIPDALTYFVQEAKALAQLNHPNVVAVYDQASDGTEQYMIMEYVDGITVERLLIERGRLAMRPALGLIDQLCAGLGYAHSKKVIHRDIKPANVFVSREKVVKLGDFGLARVMREIEIRQTDVRGTPLYMAPEQVTGTNISHRSDLYAIGCTLFELIAGRPPFIDGNILHHHVMTPPPLLSSLVPETPPALDELIAACLVKDSAERIDSALAIQERVRAIAAEL